MPQQPVTPPAPSAPETSLWVGHTSQWVHFWFYFICVLLAAAAIAGIQVVGSLAAAGLAVPALMWLIRWWLTRTTTYELTTQRFRVRSGVLSRRLEEVELFRVRDYVLNQPLLLRMLGLGNLTLVSSDASTPNVVVRAIPAVESVREQLRDAVQIERERRRVRAFDMIDGNQESPLG